VHLKNEREFAKAFADIERCGLWCFAKDFLAQNAREFPGTFVKVVGIPIRFFSFFNALDDSPNRGKTQPEEPVDLENVDISALGGPTPPGMQSVGGLSAHRTSGGAGGGTGAASFSFASREAWLYDGRMVRVVNTPTGPRAFYRRTGEGGEFFMGAQPRDWVPFLGFKPNPGGAQFVKPPSAMAPSTPLTLYRWGNQEAYAASQWIQAQHRYASPLATNVGQNWGRIQQRLEELGAFVEYPLLGR
jgi:hypothetical protein